MSRVKRRSLFPEGYPSDLQQIVLKTRESGICLRDASRAPIHIAVKTGERFVSCLKNTCMGVRRTSHGVGLAFQLHKALLMYPSFLIKHNKCASICQEKSAFFNVSQKHYSASASS